MKTLIIYTTKYGSAGKCANILKSKIAGEVMTVNLMKENAPDLADYDNVILGGSFYVGKIQKKLTDYIKAHLPELMQKKVALYICAGQTPEIRQQELETGFPKELYDHAVSREIFGSEIHMDKMNFMERLIVKKVAGWTESYSDLYEDKIEKLAKAIAG